LPGRVVLFNSQHPQLGLRTKLAEIDFCVKARIKLLPTVQPQAESGLPAPGWRPRGERSGGPVQASMIGG